MSRNLSALMCAASFIAAGAALAQSWPAKPVRFVLPVGSGTSPDVIGRVLTDQLSRKLGQQFLIENLTGGQGLIAAQNVARAAPDGYSYFYGGVGLVTDNLLYKNIPYDPERDFTPVAMIYETGTFTIAVRPDLPAKNVPDLIALAKASPGKYSYGFFAVGGPALWGPWLTHVAGINMLGVPYKAPAQLLQDAVGGRLDMVFGSYTAVEAMTKAGKLRVIGISAPARIATLPDIQSIAETLPGFFIGGTGVLVAPSGTPVEIIRRLNREIDLLVREPAYVQRLNAGGTTVNGAGTPESIAVYLKDLRDLYGRIVRELKVQPE
ncbi:MAG: tripartite tricarboxylate transporter substrate binding protein [Betaproteobacteria bacterium]|nr:tripartite tricarboxylate transporter substrate binding protein [Betaproteobacteria bacterium]